MGQWKSDECVVSVSRKLNPVFRDETGPLHRMLQKPRKTCDYEYLRTGEWTRWRREWANLRRNRDGHVRSSYVLSSNRNLEVTAPGRVTAEALLCWGCRHGWLPTTSFRSELLKGR